MNLSNDKIVITGNNLLSCTNAYAVYTSNIVALMAAKKVRIADNIEPTGQINTYGTQTNDSAATGAIGEYFTQSASGVSLVNATAKTITQISLGPGDWDVWGFAAITGAASTTTTQFACNISPTTNNVSSDYTQMIWPSQTTGSNILSLPTRRTRVFVASGTTTYYLVIQANFATSTLTGGGYISASRVR
jgi:hypothetical protein